MYYERTFITFAAKLSLMKASIFIKVFLILPLILTIDYVLMVLLGCASCLFGFGKDFYCGTYCFIGKGLLLFSAGIFIYIIFPEIKKGIRHKKDAQAN